MQKGWGVGAITGRWSQGHEGPRPQCLPKPLLCLPSPWRLSGPLWWRHHAPKSLMGALPPRRHLHLHTCSGLPQLCPPAGPGDKPGGMPFRFPTRDLPRPASDPQRFARVPPRCLWHPPPRDPGSTAPPLGPNATTGSLSEQQRCTEAPGLHHRNLLATHPPTELRLLPEGLLDPQDPSSHSSTQAHPTPRAL